MVTFASFGPNDGASAGKTALRYSAAGVGGACGAGRFTLSCPVEISFA